MSAHLEFLEGAGARASRWILAAAMMVSMHAAAGAIALINWPVDESSDEEAGAFMLELAPVPVAPPTEKLNLAIGPRAEEAAAAVAPTEEIKEKSAALKKASKKKIWKMSAVTGEGVPDVLREMMKAITVERNKEKEEQ